MILRNDQCKVENILLMHSAHVSTFTHTTLRVLVIHGMV